MELTYENMMEFLTKKYYGIMPSIEPETEDKLRECFAPDSIVRVYRKGEGIKIRSGKEFIKHVSSHYEVYRAKLLLEPFPLRIIIDEKKKMAGVLLKEQELHPPTGEVLREYYVSAHIELCLDKDGKIRIKSVFIQP